MSAAGVCSNGYSASPRWPPPCSSTGAKSCPHAVPTDAEPRPLSPRPAPRAGQGPCESIGDPRTATGWRRRSGGRDGPKVPRTSRVVAWDSPNRLRGPARSCRAAARAS
jgi:hypothetical protein